MNIKKHAFTLTEVLVAVTIVGLIAAAVLPSVITKFQNTLMQRAYDKQITSIVAALKNLPTQEKVSDFTKSSMYLSNETNDYESSSGLFLKRYFKINKYCGSNIKECFPSNYTEITKSNGKTTFSSFEDTFNGSCAILKNGASICIRPQIGNNDISGWIDVNGKKGPNVNGRDLRSFIIDSQGGFSVETDSNSPTSSVWDTELDCKPDDASAPNSCCTRWVKGSDWNNLTIARRQECCSLSSADLTYNSTCCQFLLENDSENAPSSCKQEENSCGDSPSSEKTGFECCKHWSQVGSLTSENSSCCNISEFKKYDTENMMLLCIYEFGDKEPTTTSTADKCDITGLSTETLNIKCNDSNFRTECGLCEKDKWNVTLQKDDTTIADEYSYNLVLDVDTSFTNANVQMSYTGGNWCGGGSIVFSPSSKTQSVHKEGCIPNIASCYIKIGEITKNGMASGNSCGGELDTYHYSGETINIVN